MTENADVEWLRHEIVRADEIGSWPTIPTDTARRLLAHIDQLEADNNAMRGFIDHLKSKLADRVDRRPTVHEIAAQLMAVIMARGTGGYSSWQDMAVDAYDAAEALVAEGRRDGRGA